MSRSRWFVGLVLLATVVASFAISARAHHKDGHDTPRGHTKETPAGLEENGCKNKRGVNKGCEAGAQQELPQPFTDVTAFATKTGFRAVVAWSASEPVSGVVHYGTTPDDLSEIGIAPGPPDTAQLAILDGLTSGTTYHYTVENLLSGAQTPVSTFEATNAYTAYGPNVEDTNALAKPNVYTLDLLVQLDSQSLPEVEQLQALDDIAAGINVFAERLYDAMDGHARIGNVLITDTLIDHAGTVPGAVPVHVPGACETPTNKADFLITTAVPFDSHTFGYAINEPCTPFYVGRAGQLVVPWVDDLHFGYVATHEMMHYGFGAPDLYPGSPGGIATGADCRNTAWDGSLMYNDGGWKGQLWELTEVDRNQTLTPCEMGTSEFTWDRARSRYTELPPPTAPEDVFNSKARGNPDGGALNVMVLDRELGGSTLTTYTPDDTNEGDCGEPGTSTSFDDPAGDATLLLGEETGVSALNDPAIDVLGGAVSYIDDGDGQVGEADTIRFEIEADDLRELPAAGSHGEHFDFGLSAGGPYMLVASWNRINPAPAYSLQQLAPTRTTVANEANGIAGTWDLETDVITVDVPAVMKDAAGETVFSVEGGSTLAGFAITSRRIAGPFVADADHATGGCAVAVPGTPVPPPPSAPPDGSLSGPGSQHSWQGGPTTGANFLLGCESVSGEACDEERIDVTVPPGGATLDVTLTADLPEVNDYDLLVFDPEGNKLGDGTEGGNPGSNERVTVDVTESGVYRVEVHAFLTVESEFSAVAKLCLDPNGCA